VMSKEARVPFEVVSAGPGNAGSPLVSVCRGEAPGTAATYLVDGDGKVVAETFGLPSWQMLRAIKQ